MKVAKLLDLDKQSHHSNSLPGVLGDGFLLQKNRIFRNIRIGAVNLGVTFVNQHSEEFLAFPLAQLGKILEQKKIPYFKTRSALEDLLRKTNSALEWDEVVDGLKKNYLFHESAHIVARKGFGQPPDVTDRKRHQELVLQILLEESFANTCEALAVVDVMDPAHRCFFEILSYSVLIEERALIQKSSQDFSLNKIFIFMHLCFLFSNFLVERVSDTDFESILEISEISKPSREKMKQLRALSRIAQTLDPRFKNVTTQLFFKMMGVDQPLSKLLNFNFLDMIRGDARLRGIMKTLASHATID